MGTGTTSAQSRRTRTTEVEKEIDILVADDAVDDAKPTAPKHHGPLEGIFMLLQLIIIMIYGLCTTYGQDVHPSTDAPADGYDPQRDIVQQYYPVFQDVHVMIFIGFGFLMTFVKTSSWSALCYNWIGSVWCLQLAILTTSFWAQVVEGHFQKIEITISKLIVGDFGAGAAMITFGAILGKCNLQQLFFLFSWEMLFYGLNEAICAELIHVSDTGGSILVHTFGAYFGVACCFFFQPKRAARSKNMMSSYQSEMKAVIGSVFLWMYWPSFNGGLAEGVKQHRVICNTVLAISGSCMGAAFTGRVLFGKLDMEMMLNATLAGGVAIGSSCDLIVKPWAAIFIGIMGGIVSAVGFAKIGPALMNSKLNLQDTCGVHSLHGMPGVFAGIVSAIYIATMENRGFPANYFTITEDGGTYGEQAGAQILALVVTLGISIFAGLTGGLIVSFEFFSPVHALFRDDDHFHGVIGKYPPHYMETSDEAFEYGRGALKRIQVILRAMVKSDKDAGTKDVKKEILDKVWGDHASGAVELNRRETLAFLNDFLAKHADEGEGADHDADVQFLTDGKVFEQIFKLLDDNGDQRIHQDEIAAYFSKLIAAEPPAEATKPGEAKGAGERKQAYSAQ